MKLKACDGLELPIEDQNDDATSRLHFTISASHDEADGLVHPHPSQIGALPSMALFEQLGVPVVLTGDPRVSSQALAGSYDSTLPVPFNQTIKVESDQFSGSLCVLLKDFPGAVNSSLSGKWLASIILQGTFTRTVQAEDLWIGQELWNQPILPASLQRVVFSTAAKFFSSTNRIKTEGEGVGFLTPLLASAQIVNVSRPGCEPDMLHTHEDMRLIDRSLVDHKGQPLSSSKRQKHFDKPSNLAQVEFDDEHVYTFVAGQNILDLVNYKLMLGRFLNLDLCSILNGQPLQLMCKNVKENKPLVSLLIWHQRLNYPEGCTARSRPNSCAGQLGTSSSMRSTPDSSCSSGGCSSSSRSSSSSSSGCITDNCASSSVPSSCSCSAMNDDDDDGSIYGSACSRLNSHNCSTTSSLDTSEADLACFDDSLFTSIAHDDSSTGPGVGISTSNINCSVYSAGIDAVALVKRETSAVHKLRQQLNMVFRAKGKPTEHEITGQDSGIATGKTTEKFSLLKSVKVLHGCFRPSCCDVVAGPHQQTTGQ